MCLPRQISCALDDRDNSNMHIISVILVFTRPIIHEFESSNIRHLISDLLAHLDNEARVYVEGKGCKLHIMHACMTLVPSFTMDCSLGSHVCGAAVYLQWK